MRAAGSGSLMALSLQQQANYRPLNISSRVGTHIQILVSCWELIMKVQIIGILNTDKPSNISIANTDEPIV